jgi:hypothetical protein
MAAMSAPCSAKTLLGNPAALGTLAQRSSREKLILLA